MHISAEGLAQPVVGLQLYKCGKVLGNQVWELLQQSGGKDELMQKTWIRYVLNNEYFRQDL